MHSLGAERIPNSVGFFRSTPLLIRRVGRGTEELLERIRYCRLFGAPWEKDVVVPRQYKNEGRIVKSSATGNDSGCSLNSLLEFLCPEVWKSNQLLVWPPDVFAVSASILERSGAYTRVVTTWPPPNPKTPRGRQQTAKEWGSWIKEVGLAWRKTAIAGRRPPTQVAEWWRSVANHSGTLLSKVPASQELWQALLQLCAAADEACEGVGIPSGDASEGNPFEVEANLLLVYREGGSLCRTVHPSRARVLPKLHTPRNGLTIRSISHNLALCPVSEIEPK
jgi:hypothetical protein